MQEIKEFIGDEKAIRQALEYLFGEGWEKLPKELKKQRKLQQERSNFVNPERGMSLGKMVEVLSRIGAFRCKIEIPIKQKEN